MATDADNPTLLQVLVLERVDRAKNMAQFYVLSIEPTLFEDLALVRRWGRIGSAGRQRIDLHPSRPIAQIELEEMARSQEAPWIPAPRVRAATGFRIPTHSREAKPDKRAKQDSDNRKGPALIAIPRDATKVRRRLGATPPLLAMTRRSPWL